MSNITPIFVVNKQLFNAEVMGSNLTSEVIDISELTGFAIHSIWTGSPVGNLLVQGSNDGTNFYTIDTHAAGGALGQHIYNAAGQHYRYVRLAYTYTSGTGALTSYISGKRI